MDTFRDDVIYFMANGKRERCEFLSKQSDEMLLGFLRFLFEKREEKGYEEGYYDGYINGWNDGKRGKDKDPTRRIPDDIMGFDYDPQTKG